MGWFIPKFLWHFRKIERSSRCQRIHFWVWCILLRLFSSGSLIAPRVVHGPSKSLRSEMFFVQLPNQLRLRAVPVWPTDRQLFFRRRGCMKRCSNKMSHIRLEWFIVCFSYWIKTLCIMLYVNDQNGRFSSCILSSSLTYISLIQWQTFNKLSGIICLVGKMSRLNVYLTVQDGWVRYTFCPRQVQSREAERAKMMAKLGELGNSLEPDGLFTTSSRELPEITLKLRAK